MASAASGVNRRDDLIALPGKPPVSPPPYPRAGRVYHTEVDVVSADQYSDHMAKTVTATEAKAKILALLDEVESGEEIEITRHGRPVARLVPARPAARLRGMFAGQVRQTVGDDELMAPIDGWLENDWLERDDPAR